MQLKVYTKQLNPWVDHLTLIEWLEAKNQTAVGSQRFVFDNTDKPIILTNKAFDLDADYKNVCPFKGLESFDFDKNTDDPLYFKGRTQLTNELLEKVQSANFLAVLGASGNGKSSVVRAGLLYSIRQTQRWQILPVITPTAEPLKALGTVIGMPAEQLTDFINHAQTERIVLVIDQFEEVFTLCKDDTEREQFFAILLAAVARTDNQFCLVIVMRADFLDKCSHYVDLAKQIQSHQIIVTPMTPAELEEAIVAPTQQVGLQIEPKLVSEMLADVKGALGSLPLLQYTLTELWKKCATQRLLTFSAYEELGKIAGTLEQGANGVYQKLSPAEQKTAQRIFIELTQLGEGTPDTRRQLSQQDLVTSLPFESAPVGEVIQKLVAANLLVTDKPKEQVAVVNIAHEALTQYWGQLREWLDGNRDAIKIQREIEEDAKKWNESNQSKHALLQGLDLNIAKNYAKKHIEKVPLSALAQDFVQCSIKRQRHYWMGVISSVVGVIFVLVGIAFYANEQRIMAEKSEQEVKKQAQIALSEKLGAQSILATRLPSAGNGYYQQALLLAIQAFKEKNTVVTRSNLLRVLQAEKPRKAFLYGHSFHVSIVVFSPNGKTLASGSFDGSVRLWDVETRQPLGQPLALAGDSFSIQSMAFSPDGKTLASGSFDGIVRLWNVETRQLLGELVNDSSSVYSVAFSPNGKLLASGNGDNTVRLWNIETKRVLSKPLVGHSSSVYSVAFSPDGKTIASGSDDKTVRLWEVETKQALSEPLVGHSSSVYSLAFSPDGKILASGSDDKTVRLWEIETKQPLGDPLVGHSNDVRTLAFGPDSKILASGSEDNSLRLWNVETGNLISETLVGHSVFVTSAFFSSSGKIIASGMGLDNTVRLWYLQTKQRLSQTLIKYFDEINSVVFSPDSKILALGSKDNTVRLLDIETRKALGEPLVSHFDDYSEVNSVAFSPDSKTIAFKNDDNALILWDVQTRQPLAKPLVGDDDFVLSVAFRSDGNTLVYGGDYLVRLWDIETKQPLGEPLIIDYSGDDIKNLVFSTDGKTFALWSVDNNIILWDFETRKALGEPLEHPGDIYSVAFSPDGKIIASGEEDGGRIMLWDVKTRQQLGEPLVSHSDYYGEVYSVAFSHDGKILASGSDDNTIRLWDVETRQSLGEPLVAHSDDVLSVAFSPDGKILASGSSDKTVRLWDVNPKSWAKKACAIVNRNFSHKEWQKYMGNHRPHEKTCPDLPKDTLGAIELTQQARELLKDGKIEEAKAKFSQAREWDASVVFGDEGLSLNCLNQN
jgi:WD40 repeat protein